MTMDADALWAQLRPDARGLVTAVIQHEATGQVLMVGYMNAEALRATLEHGRVTFWSRSRDELWEKGATSGNTLHAADLRVDCDGDALLVRAHPAGPTCHTGAASCFFRRVEGSDPTALPADDGPAAGADPTFERVFAVILERQAGRGMTNAEDGSYVRRLLDRGAPKINAKTTEEAGELCEAVAEQSDDRVASEAADLLFHAMVGLAHRGVHLRDVARVHGRPAAVVHRDHRVRHDQVRHPPGRRGHAAELVVGRAGGSSVQGSGRLEVAHGGYVSDPGAPLRSASLIAHAALTSPMWLSACGWLPSILRVRGSTSSASSPTSLTNATARSNTSRARAGSPASAQASASQNVHSREVPSSPGRASSAR